jgi:hypothetical protein
LSKIVHELRFPSRSKENSSQSSNGSKKDKVKKVLALINEIQIQDSCNSDEESAAGSPTKTPMVIPPDIWITLPLEAKKRLLNERKCQQQEDDKMKKSLAVATSTAVPND